MNALEVTPDQVYLAAASYQHVYMYDLVANNSSPVINFEGATKNITDIGIIMYEISAVKLCCLLHLYLHFWLYSTILIHLIFYVQNIIFILDLIQRKTLLLDLLCTLVLLQITNFHV